MSQDAWEAAMGMGSYATSPAAAEDRAIARDVASLVRSTGTTGMTTAEATRLLGYKSTDHLERAEKMGLVRSVRTGRRHLGRRWFAPSES